MAVFPAATSVLAGAMTISAEGWGDREAKRERQREREGRGIIIGGRVEEWRNELVLLLYILHKTNTTHLVTLQQVSTHTLPLSIYTASSPLPKNKT